jgi:hypothetical protein
MAVHITVVNRHTTREKWGVYVGRPTVLGNRYVIGRDGTREECIEKYKVWLQNELDTEPDGKVAKEMRALLALAREEELRLLCSCKPLACHADVIREILIELDGRR